jgi:hypothetical protein
MNALFWHLSACLFAHLSLSPPFASGEIHLGGIRAGMRSLLAYGWKGFVLVGKVGFFALFLSNP